MSRIQENIKTGAGTGTGTGTLRACSPHLIQAKASTAVYIIFSKHALDELVVRQLSCARRRSLEPRLSLPGADAFARARAHTHTHTHTNTNTNTNTYTYTQTHTPLVRETKRGSEPAQAFKPSYKHTHTNNTRMRGAVSSFPFAGMHC